MSTAPATKQPSARGARGFSPRTCSRAGSRPQTSALSLMAQNQHSYPQLRRRTNMNRKMTKEKMLSDCTTPSPATVTSRWLLLAVFAVASLLPTCALGGLVPWSQNGHFYEVVSEPGGITWTNASNAATGKGGYLATLTSSDENAFVFELTLAVPGVWFASNEWRIGPWLGGTDTQIEGTWRWVTGEPWGYTAWLSGQPDNWQNEDHLAFWGRLGVAATWNDSAGSASLRGYVVEYLPEPTTFSLIGLGAMSLLAARRRQRRDVARRSL